MNLISVKNTIPFGFTGLQFFRNLNRINIRIDQAIEGYRTQPPGFLKHMHEANSDYCCTRIFIKSGFHLINFHRHVGHREPAHDYDGFWIELHGCHAYRHANVIDMADLLSPVLINERNEYLLQFERAEGKCKQFNKWRAGAWDTVIDDLIAFFQSLCLDEFLERAQDTRDSVEDFFCGYVRSTVLPEYDKK